jgi:PAS domain S-box-containing protein
LAKGHPTNHPITQSLMVNLKEIELLYNAMPTPSVILHPDAPDFTIAAVNKAFLVSTYKNAEDLIGQPFFSVFPANVDDDGSRTVNITQAFDHVLNSKRPYLVLKHRYDLPAEAVVTPEVRYWNIETYPLLDESGTLRYIVQSSTDVTALVAAEMKLEENNGRLLKELEGREQMECALQLSNERYNYVNKATNDAIYDWDIEMDHIEWGHAYYHAYGCPTEGRFSIDKWKALIYPQDIERLERSLDETLRNPGAQNWTSDYKLMRMDGRYAEVEENGYILRDEHGRAKRMIGVLRDVTSRKKAEEELETLKNTFSELFQLNPLPMWVYDLHTLQFLDVNEAAVAHYGYSKVEFLSMSIQDIRPQAEAAAFLETLRSEVEPGKPHSIIGNHLKKSGETILVHIKGNSIRYGTKEARLVVAIDITEKTRFERALIDSERRFKTLIQESSDLIAIMDGDGVYKYVSPTIERLMGITPEQVVGKNAFNAVHEDHRAYLIEQMEALAEKKSIKLAPYRLTDQLGRTHWMETIITDMRADEAIDGIICNARIVTDRVEQELKIKEHLERLNIVSKATSDTIWDLNHQTGKVIWNQGIQSIFGYDCLESDYQWWYERVHPEDLERVTGVVQYNVDHKLSRWTSEYRFRCADGSYKDILDRGFLIFDPETGGVVKMIGAFQDISERVAYTKAVEEHNSRLKEIAWTQAHLVRGPLTSILGLMALLKDPATDEATKTSVLTYLDHSAAKLDEIIMEIINKSHESLKDA